MSPETSVIIPVRNGAAFLAETIASVLVQLKPHDEVLVVDDRSTDNSRAVAAGIGDPRVKILDGPGKNVAAARNVGLLAAAGEYITFLDHDDLWPEGRQRALLAALADPEVDVAYGRLHVRFETDARPHWTRVLHGRHVGGSVATGLYRRAFLSRIAGFDETMPIGEDTDFFLRLTEAGMKSRLCDIDGLIYRRHATNVTNDFGLVKYSILPAVRRRLARAEAGSGTISGAPNSTSTKVLP